MPKSSHTSIPISVEPYNIHFKKMASFIAVKVKEMEVTSHESNFSTKNTIIVSNPRGYFKNNGDPLQKDSKCII